MNHESLFTAFPDAWMSGQVQSKVWLCRELERLQFATPPVIWLLGGWYARTAEILFLRDRLRAKQVRSFDIDPEATRVAEIVCENWVFSHWRFRAFTVDCNVLTYDDESYARYHTERPDIVINTSVEHFVDDAWWHNIPQGMLVALQSNNMMHDDHAVSFATQDEFMSAFPIKERLFAGAYHFPYQEGAFTRWMLIGRK